MRVIAHSHDLQHAYTIAIICGKKLIVFVALSIALSSETIEQGRFRR